MADGWQAEWSPDGSRIVFRTFDFNGPIVTINPDGSDPQIILKGKGGGVTSAYLVALPKWAPTGAHLVYLRFPVSLFGSKVDPHIYRAKSDGGSKTNLTEELETGPPPAGLVIPVAWR